MTSPHTFIADGFFIAGILLLLLKFWTWEEAKRQTTRKTAVLLALSAVCALVLIVGACALTNYMNRPQVKLETKAAVSDNGGSSGQAASSQVPSSQTPAPAPSPKQEAPKKKAAARQQATSSGAPTQPHAAPPQSTPNSASQPTYQQQCVGSACAQGDHPTATYNQFGAPKLIMTDAQRDAITSSMKKFSGMKVWVGNNVGEPDVEQYAKQLVLGLQNAGLIVDHSEAIQEEMLGARESGISFVTTKNLLNVASVLAQAMKDAGLITNPVPTTVSPDVPELPQGAFSVMVKANR
jgi:hypothetical protein